MGQGCGSVGTQDAGIDLASGGEPAPETMAGDAPQGTSADTAPADRPAGAEAGTDARDAASDPRPEAAAAACDPSLPFGAPSLVAGLNETNASTDGFWLSDDGLTAYISSQRTGSQGFDVYTARRGSLADTFAAPALLAPVNTTANERAPVLAPGGLSLLFYRSGTAGEDIYVSMRAGPLAAFPTPAVAGVINMAGVDENMGSFTSDGRMFYFSSRRSGVFRIYRAAISAAGEFQTPEEVGELNAGGMGNVSPLVTTDHLGIYFQRTETASSGDIWFARRSTLADGFGSAAAVAELNSTANDFPDYLTPDGCTIYFTSSRRNTATGNYELFSATRPASAAAR